jgi:hypothetical protein
MCREGTLAWCRAAAVLDGKLNPSRTAIDRFLILGERVVTDWLLFERAFLVASWQDVSMVTTL